MRTSAVAGMMLAVANAAGPIYTVRTSAMEPTLLVGDHVLAPGGEPIGELRRGDVIVFHFPPDPTVVLVKRLIGLPGDHVRIMNGILVLNSKPVSEPYVRHSAGASAPPFFSNYPSHADKDTSILPATRKMLERHAASGELIIPEGEYFVLGDNRDYSYDSRSWGLIKAGQVIGLAHEVVSSEDPQTKMSRAGRLHLTIPRGSLK